MPGDAATSAPRENHFEMPRPAAETPVEPEPHRSPRSGGKMPHRPRSCEFVAFASASSCCGRIGTGAGQAKGYEFQSGGIVEMLEDLKEKFEDERRHLEKDEVGSEHASKFILTPS